jgi:peptidoglycan hydrolase-like protein with peptidoglycan-binding domain
MRFRLCVVAVLVAVVSLGVSTVAPAAGSSSSSTVLRKGSHGAKVKALQWLLTGHRPNVFTKVKGTFSGKPNGLYGAATDAAVYAYKYRLGYPMSLNRRGHTVAGPYFFALMRGTKTRPAGWVANAARRLKATEPGATPAALRIRTLLTSQLGVTERPDGSNRGPRISYSVGSTSSYQSSTGAYGAAWCVSFTQWAFHRVTGRYFGDRSAGVFYVVGWARPRNYLHARPKVGAIVAFMDGQGHMGTVVKVTASGFVSIEGNASNRVLERFHSLGDRRPVFIYLPGVA